MTEFKRGYIKLPSGEYREETDAELRLRILANKKATPGLMGVNGRIDNDGNEETES